MGPSGPSPCGPSLNRVQGVDGGAGRSEGSAMTPPKVLLIGYSGADHTGAEALLQADIEDLRAVLRTNPPGC